MGPDLSSALVSPIPVVASCNPSRTNAATNPLTVSATAVLMVIVGYLGYTIVCANAEDANGAQVLRHIARQQQSYSDLPYGHIKAHRF